VTAAVLVAAQSLDRLSGRVLTPQGEPAKDAEVRVEALYGFAGSDYLGQRTFSARTDGKGGWALLAFKAGIWVFEASTPGSIPDAVALPFNLVTPQGKGLAGVEPVWHPILAPTPIPSGEMGQILADALEAARAGRPERVASLLTRVADTSDSGIQEAAGRICLVMRDAAVARPFFRRALERDLSSFRAARGMGSTALMQRDVDAAARSFAQARDLTRDKAERSYLTAAIAELNKAHNVMRATY
jgi:hypothetical protein